MKETIYQWNEVLDPDDIRQFEKYPEIAHLTRDDLSDSMESYTSHSMASILSFETKEIEIKQPPKASTPMTTETTPSDLSDPVLNEKTTAEVELLKAEAQHYCSKLEKYTLKIKGFQVMLETIME